VAFLSNKDDEKKIRNPAFRKLTAKKIANGIEAFLRSAGAKNDGRIKPFRYRHL